MNDLIPNTRVEGEIRLDGENIYKDIDVIKLRKKGRYGSSQKAKPVPDEYL